VSAQSFERVLSRKDVAALCFGAMIGWSWVVLTGDWLQTAGPLGAACAFLAGGAAVTLIGLTYAELAAAMPVVGGEHAYSLRALGPAGSFVCTWAIVLGYASVVAFEAAALPTVAEYLFPGIARVHLWTVAGFDVYLGSVAVGVAGALAVTATNVLGIRPAAVLQSVATLLILASGVLLASGAGMGGAQLPFDLPFEGGMRGFTAVLVMVPFMFVGFDVLPQAAEEVDLPFREIGRALVASVLLAAIWYVLVIASVSASLPATQLAASRLATADAASAAWGSEWAGRAIVLGGLAGIVTSWNAFMVGGSRAVYALARAGMLPAPFARLHARHRTPHTAILLIGLLSCLAPLFGRSVLVWLVDAGGLGIVVAYGMVAVSFLVLRRREPAMERPFRVRRGGLVGSAALAVSVGIGALYLPGSPAALSWPEEWGIVVAWCALGGTLFAWTRIRRRPDRRGRPRADRAPRPRWRPRP
jgi:amino acid transporter